MMLDISYIETLLSYNNSIKNRLANNTYTSNDTLICLLNYNIEFFEKLIKEGEANDT